MKKFLLIIIIFILSSFSIHQEEFITVKQDTIRKEIKMSDSQRKQMELREYQNKQMKLDKNFEKMDSTMFLLDKQNAKMDSILKKKK